MALTRGPRAGFELSWCPPTVGGLRALASWAFAGCPSTDLGAQTHRLSGLGACWSLGESAKTNLSTLVSGVQDSQGWLEPAPATLPYLAVGLIGGQLSRPKGKQTQPLGPQDVPCGRGLAKGEAPCSSMRGPSCLWHLRPLPGGLPGRPKRARRLPGQELPGRRSEGRGTSLGLLCTQPGSLGSWRVPGTEDKGDPEPGRGLWRRTCHWPSRPLV